MIKRRFLARLFLPFFFVWCVMVPRQTYAFVPLLAPVAVAIFDAGGAIIAADAFGSALSALVGGLALAAVLGSSGDSSNAYGQVKVPTTLAVPVAPPVAPSSAVPVYTWGFSGLTVAAANGCNGGSTSFSSGDAQTACTFRACMDSYDVNTTRKKPFFGTLTNVQSTIATCTIWDGDWYQMSGGFPISKAYFCPDGYSVSGSTCVLSDARAVTQDGRQDVSRSGTDYSLSATDLHGENVGSIQTGVNPNDTVVLSGTRDGRPQRVTVTANPSGGSTITQSVGQVDSNGQTYVHNDSIVIGSDGRVTSVSGSNTAQNIVYNNITNNYDVVTPAASTVPLAVPSSAAPSTPLVFPSDYARSGEVAAAAAPISSRLDTLHHDLSDTTTLADPAVPDVSTMPTFGSTFDNLRDWSVPAHASVCPQPSMNLLGQTYVMNSHCQLINDNFGILRAAMIAAWLILSIFIVLRA